MIRLIPIEYDVGQFHLDPIVALNKVGSSLDLNSAFQAKIKSEHSPPLIAPYETQKVGLTS